MTGVTFRSDIAVELVQHTVSDEMIARAARVSTGADQLDQEDFSGLINFLMKNRHGSPFEHGVFTWRVEAPIFVWREHMRHRIASYNEESGRYKELAPVFYIPGPDRCLIQVGKAGAYSFEAGSQAQYDATVSTHQASSITAYAGYRRLLDLGVAKEVARMSLPVNIYSAAYVSMNPRALMNFLSLRTKAMDSFFPSYPQREIEMVAEQYEATFAELMPLTYAAFDKNGRVAP